MKSDNCPAPKLVTDLYEWSSVVWVRYSGILSSRVGRVLSVASSSSLVGSQGL